MIDTIHYLIERFGLFAIFLGCLAEGETAAVLGGLFAHQGLFAVWQAFLAAWAGAFLGDAVFYLTGKYFADTDFVNGLRDRPAFAGACRMVQAHPVVYVLLNRYVYGFRLVGGVVAGLSGISLPKFMVLNAVAALIWAVLFIGLGYVFGQGAEHLFGAELAKHERIFVGLALGLFIAGVGWYSGSKFIRKIHA